MTDAAATSPVVDLAGGASKEHREERSDNILPKIGPGDGDSRLTPDGRAALLALVENDDFGNYLDDICGGESISISS